MFQGCLAIVEGQQNFVLAIASNNQKLLLLVNIIALVVALVLGVVMVMVLLIIIATAITLVVVTVTIIDVATSDVLPSSQLQTTNLTRLAIRGLQHK